MEVKRIDILIKMKRLAFSMPQHKDASSLSLMVLALRTDSAENFINGMYIIGHIAMNDNGLNLDEVGRERMQQDIKWGRIHDEAHSFQNWIIIILQRIQKYMVDHERKRAIQIAAVAVAAIESIIGEHE